MRLVWVPHHQKASCTHDEVHVGRRRDSPGTLAGARRCWHENINSVLGDQVAFERDVDKRYNNRHQASREMLE